MLRSDRRKFWGSRVKAKVHYLASFRGTQRPPTCLDASQLAHLRAQGCSIREIAEVLGVSRSLVHKTLVNRGEIKTAITEG
jgi:hypothetical protein